MHSFPCHTTSSTPAEQGFPPLRLCPYLFEVFNLSPPFRSADQTLMLTNPDLAQLNQSMINKAQPKGRCRVSAPLPGEEHTVHTDCFKHHHPHLRLFPPPISQPKSYSITQKYGFGLSRALLCKGSSIYPDARVRESALVSMDMVIQNYSRCRWVHSALLRDLQYCCTRWEAQLPWSKKQQEQIGTKPKRIPKFWKCHRLGIQQTQPALPQTTSKSGLYGALPWVRFILLDFISKGIGGGTQRPRQRLAAQHNNLQHIPDQQQTAITPHTPCSQQSPTTLQLPIASLRSRNTPSKDYLIFFPPLPPSSMLSILYTEPGGQSSALQAI